MCNCIHSRSAQVKPPPPQQGLGSTFQPHVFMNLISSTHHHNIVTLDIQVNHVSFSCKDGWKVTYTSFLMISLSTCLQTSMPRKNSLYLQNVHLSSLKDPFTNFCLTEAIFSNSILRTQNKTEYTELWRNSCWLDIHFWHQIGISFVLSHRLQDLQPFKMSNPCMRKAVPSIYLPNL